MIETWHIYHTKNCFSLLNHDSYIDCSRVLSFKSSELTKVQKVQNNTRETIRKTVSASKLIAPVHKKLICGE